MNTSWEEFWWNNITGPRFVISRVSNALLENKMVVLKVPSDLPWRHSMRRAVHTAFHDRTEYRDIVIEQVDVIDDNREGLPPGKLILNRFASPQVSTGYRQRSKTTVQEYISAKKVLKNRIIWVKGLAGETANQWISFCRNFSHRTAADGLFVLEVHGEISVTIGAAMQCIDFLECVSGYDVRLFNSFILNSRTSGKVTDVWKNYIATVSAEICGVDAEISEMLIDTVDFRRESPIDGLKRIAEMPEFSRRGADENSDNVLRLVRKGETDELEHRLWAAQIQVLFPVIEFERVQLIRRWKEQIQFALDITTQTQYGEMLTDAIDAELGTLRWLMKQRREDGLYVMYIPDDNDRERIKFLHECRNKLAHATCCLPQEVERLLG